MYGIHLQWSHSNLLLSLLPFSEIFKFIFAFLWQKDPNHTLLNIQLYCKILVSLVDSLHRKLRVHSGPYHTQMHELKSLSINQNTATKSQMRLWGLKHDHIDWYDEVWSCPCCFSYWDQKTLATTKWKLMIYSVTSLLHHDAIHSITISFTQLLETYISEKQNTTHSVAEFQMSPKFLHKREIQKVTSVQNF